MDQLFYEEFDFGVREEDIRLCGWYMVVFRENGGTDTEQKLVAALLVEPKPDSVMKLHWVSVAPDERGRGYGTALVCAGS